MWCLGRAVVLLSNCGVLSAPGILFQTCRKHSFPADSDFKGYFPDWALM